MERYEPKYKWRRTKLDDNDVPTDNDWSGYDGEIVIGRIQKQPHGPMKDRWLWTLNGGRRTASPTTSQMVGYQQTD